MTQQASGETSGKAATTAVPTIPLVGSKMRKKMAGRLQESVSAPTSDFAKRQLEKMGWTAGTGLGRKRDGIVSHIKVQKRAENAGLGTERQAVEERQTAESWWKDSLGDTLARLSSKSGKKKRKKAYTDEELFEATGGVRFGTKGSRGRQAKYRRTETESFDENKVEIPRNVDKNHESMDADKLFKEDTLNEEVSKRLSTDTDKKKSTKDKKKKKSKKEGKK
eukprot:scaffold2767_cov177-Amphora_coffeaeformis.AAC.66